MITPKENNKLIYFMENDIAERDVTTELLEERECVAEIKAKEEATIAGLDEAELCFEYFGVQVKRLVEEGSRVREGATVMALKGSNKGILQAERTALNMMSRMSGVASLCAKARELAEGSNVRIALTRKTIPGFNEFDKKAAIIAGIDPHRFNLSDMVLLKDNHLKFFKSVKEAVRKAKKESSFSKKIEVEAKNKGKALKAAEECPDIIMLDNFSVRDAGQTIKEIRAMNKKVLIECSGGIDLNNLKSYIELKPDIVSLGFLTKSARGIDFSLNIK
ncbi:MAG: carboxylating nicotinate-nucleotide diphosphorylase [archaeon]|nr:carboxylating nicotinate-nucleotide diphosphorylase [Candidatus Micrarchaeota archaeon]